MVAVCACAGQTTSGNAVRMDCVAEHGMDEVVNDAAVHDFEPELGMHFGEQASAYRCCNHGCCKSLRVLHSMLLLLNGGDDNNVGAPADTDGVQMGCEDVNAWLSLPIGVNFGPCKELQAKTS